MHPNPLFRSDDRELQEALIDRVGFGMVVCATPDGLRAAHTPVMTTGRGTVQFHLARGNALTPHLDGATALLTINGPDGYVSPRWYDDRDTVPTWDYIALEIDGRVRTMDEDSVEAMLHAIIERHERRVEGERWLAAESSEKTWNMLRKGIVGFELEIEAMRPTFKLSQKRSPQERERIARGHELSGRSDLAGFMRAYAG